MALMLKLVAVVRGGKRARDCILAVTVCIFIKDAVFVVAHDGIIARTADDCHFVAAAIRSEGRLFSVK